MRRIALLLLMACSINSAYAQKTSPSLKLKSYQRGYISGVAPTPIVEIGGKQTEAASATREPEYFIYLIANKVPYLKIERIWIRQQLYLATINLVSTKPVIVKNGIMADTLIRYTDEAVYQIKITGKDSTGIKPKKDIAHEVKANEMVLRLTDKNGKVFTRTAKHISILEAERGQ